MAKAAPKCEDVTGCDKQAQSVVRTKQIRQAPGAGVETTIIWDIADTGEFLRTTGSCLCVEHRDRLLEKLGEIL